MKLYKNQKGFGLVEGLLTVIALALIVGVGYYVYSSQKSNKSTKDEQTSQQSTEATKQDQYFKFEELGVKIKLTPELDGLKYSLGGYSQNTPYYYVTTKNLEEQIIKCAEDSGSLPDMNKSFGSISKASGKFRTELYVTLLKQFDDFYITMSSPQASACADPFSDQAANVGKNITELQTAFQQAFKEAQEIQ